MSDRPVTISALSMGMLLAVSQNVRERRESAPMPMQASTPMSVASTDEMSAMLSEL